MNVVSRAHRILRQLACYESASASGMLSHEHLGVAIGCYRNPMPTGECVSIFAEGMSWPENDRTVIIRFSDIEDIDLPQQKTSTELVLRMRNGDRERLPVRGHDGKFLDSLEMLRFLMRVRQDIEKTETSG